MSLADASKLMHLRDAAHAAATAITADILTLVEQETSSYDKPALDQGIEVVDQLMRAALGAPEATQHHFGGEQGDVLVATYDGTGAGVVAVLAHYDTVWPTGTLAGWPISIRTVDGVEQISGPGIFDMKAGLVQAIWALRLLREQGIATPTVIFVFTGDEEIGSLASRPFIEDAGQRADATLVLEASADGAVKTGRKGVGRIHIETIGVESHAGLDPLAGASAIHAMARVIDQVVAIARPDRGTTVNVGLVDGGSGSNVVAGHASAMVDVRVTDSDEQARVAAALEAAQTGDPRVALRMDMDWSRPPMVLTDATRPLLDLAQSVASELGFDLQHASVGGASDANFVAALGRPVLCGLGAVGAGAHARGEWIDAASVAPQTALVAGMFGELADGL